MRSIVIGALGVIALILTVAIGASLIAARREGKLALSEQSES